MKFAQPLWLLAGLIACAALVWRNRRMEARQRTELLKFASLHLITQLTASVSSTRRRVKRALVIAGVALLAMALARPLFGFRWEETKRQGLDLLFAVDTSRSMLAPDVKPDRLTRAKMAVEDLLAKMDGDRVGLIAFAGGAFLQCPLTLDADAFRQSLEALDTKIIPRGGTDISAAIHEAEAALEGNGNNERILVLLTDGEDLEGNALETARAAAKNGLKIFTVGVGSAKGELVPLADEMGGAQFVKDSSGQFVKSRLDETMLQQIAEATGGMYQPLGQQSQGLETIYQRGLSQFTRHEVASRKQKVYLERYQWPLGLGLLCLVLEPLLGIRRNKRRTKPAANARPALAAAWNKMSRPSAPAAVVPVLALLALVTSAHASAGSAEKAFQKGDYAKAEQDYQKAAAKHPDQPVLQFNHGAAAYKAGQFEPAAKSFASAMKADDPALKQDNFYNLGNTQYRLGQQTGEAKAEETIKTWEQAVQSYESALQLRPDDADAKFNRDFVKRKIEELKKQQQQKQDQKQQDQKNQDQNKPDDQQKQPDQKQEPDKQNQSSQTGSKPEPQKQEEQKKEQAKQNSGGQPDKPEQASQKPDQKDQPAQAGQKPEPQKQDGELQPRNPQPKAEGKEQADARPAPGKMSREEAKQLLDSLKSGDRKMPLTQATRGNESARNDEPLKDW